MLIDGRQLADEVLGKLREEVEALRSTQGELTLAAILVGDDLEFKKFVELKGRIAESIGVKFKMFQFDESVDNGAMIYHSKKISDEFDGALIELPLPDYLDQQKVLDQISPDKDVDVLSSESQRLFHENKSLVLPPAVEALKIVLEKFNINPKGKKAAVFGQGILVGEPISHWLEYRGAEVFRINSKTENPNQYSKQADLVVTGVGKPGLVIGDMVKEGVVVIDFGYGKDSNNIMKGDIDFESVAPKASLITPVPGGMGPILIAAVLKNLVKLNS